MTAVARLPTRQRGAALVLVLLVILLLGLFSMALLSSSDADLRQSRAYADNVVALADAEAGIQEVLFRLNAAASTRLSVNSLVSYDPRIDPDPMKLRSNNIDDDGNGFVDDSGDLNLGRDWTLRMTLTLSDPVGGPPYVVADGAPASGPPYGPSVAVATIQPQATWRPYTTPDLGSADVLTLRYKLDTDLPALAAVPHPSPQIVFWSPALVTNGVDDATSLAGLGGDGNAANDSPYNIAVTDSGGVKRRATGSPLLLLRVTGRGVRGQRTVARRAIEAEIAGDPAPVSAPGLCGCDEVSSSNDAFVLDSYRSSAGPYASQTPGRAGNIGCNDKCDLRGKWSGDAICGGDINHAETLSGNATAGNNINGVPGGVATPKQLPKPSPCACAASELTKVDNAVLAVKAANDNATLPVACRGPALTMSSGSCTLPPGTYYFQTITLSGSAQLLTAATPATPVRIFLEKDIKLSGNAVVGGDRPGNLVLTGGDGGSFATLNNFATLSAVLDMPRTKLQVKDTTVFYGGGRVYRLEGNNSGDVHLDEDLFVVAQTTAAYRVVAWRELN